MRENGNCLDCGARLSKGWHADHRVPHSRNGATDTINGAAVCAKCNLKKGSKMIDFLHNNKKTQVDLDLPAGVSLREWQRKALRRVAAVIKPNFLLVAVPAAGKTLFSLLVAHQFFGEKRIKRVVVVCPTNHLRYQWAENAHRIGLNLDPDYCNADGRETPDYHGVVVTYQQVAAQPDLFRANCRDETLVIFDEVHHVGDELTWGKALRHAFEPAVFRLSLSGTPFRSDAHQIPFVTYAGNRCQPDFVYGYGSALADGVVRPVYFPTIEGVATWLGSDGKFKQRSLLDQVSGREAGERWRTILDPGGDWLRDVIRQADENLTEMRRNNHPEAAGLIVAVDQPHAERLVATVEAVTGTKPVLAISDKPDAADAIKRFAASSSGERWIIAVKMVSEGVDIPRLRVCVYATNVCSELFLIQVIGRLLRKQTSPEEQSAALYIPYVAELVKYAERIREVREHVLQRKLQDETGAAQNQSSADNAAENGGGTTDGNANAGNGRNRAGSMFLPISSESKLHHTIFDGEQFTREELSQAEQLNSELGLAIPAVMSAKILRCGMALGAGEVVQAASQQNFQPPAESNSQNQSLRAKSTFSRNEVRSHEGAFGKSKFGAAKLDDSPPDAHLPVYVQQKALRRQAQKLAGQLAFALDVAIEDVHREWIEQGGASQSKATIAGLRQKVEWLSSQIGKAAKR